MCQALVLGQLVLRECFPIKGGTTGEVFRTLRIVHAVIFIPCANPQLVIVLFRLRLLVPQCTDDFFEAIHPPLERLIRVRIRKESLLRQLLQLRELLDESPFLPFGLLMYPPDLLISIVVVGGGHIALACILPAAQLMLLEGHEGLVEALRPEIPPEGVMGLLEVLWVRAHWP